MAGYQLCGAGVNAYGQFVCKVEDGMDIRMRKEVGTDNTLIIAVIIQDDAFDHMFAEIGFHALTYKMKMGEKNKMINSHALGREKKVAWREAASGKI
uniref:Uncharacterized protein n=1 Tax=Romanomermis culicivorax TaxID=13658 RepID=A0A915IYL8_ROMCU